MVVWGGVGLVQTAHSNQSVNKSFIFSLHIINKPWLHGKEGPSARWVWTALVMVALTSSLSTVDGSVFVVLRSVSESFVQNQMM